MSACTFFGHRDCPPDACTNLHGVLVDLIENHNVNMFYVGNKGSYDSMVRSCLQELAQLYPQINYAVVLDRMPQKRGLFDAIDYSDTMLPEGIESVHPRFAIAWRNKWMIQQSTYVVTYITHDWGGAAQYAEMAEHQGRNVINLAKR